MKVSLRAPAKVNLSLHVLGRRPDGYHAVRTTLLAVDLADRLELRARAGSGRVSLEVSGDPSVPADGTNLAARAAAAVLVRAGSPEVDLELLLAKAIPAAAGLGGGSSDAAAAALGAARALGLAHPDLGALLAELGSDCPFFASAPSGFARCTGRGELVEPLGAPPPFSLLLVTPALAAPTARVYAAWRPADAGGDAGSDDWTGLRMDEARALLVNDLEPAALRAVPGLASWRALLDGRGLGHARLAGSGSSFFALFAELDEARDAAGALATDAARSGLGVRLCRAVRAAGHGALVVSEKSSG